MMAALTLLVTTAGLDALVDAQSGSTDPIVITQIGLTDTAFTMAPTLTALPGEFKRLAGVGGQAVNETTLHIVAQDDSNDVYSARGIGIYLADGTLFAVYSQPLHIVSKVSISAFLIAVDIAFLNAVDVAVGFGNASFLYPPATHTVKGVAYIATGALADAGDDDNTIMTPLQVKRRLDALGAQVAALLATTLAETTITGEGLATGGGPLSQDNVLTVLAASGADLLAAAASDRAVTPASFGALAHSMTAPAGSWTLPGGLILKWVAGSVDPAGSEPTQTLLFAPGFPTDCLSAMVAMQLSAASIYADTVYQLVGAPTAGGVTVQRQRTSDGSDSMSTRPIVWALGY